MAEFPFYTGLPANCMRADCDYFIALGPNPFDSTSVEIYLEGNAAGWVAVGFSRDTMMVSNSVTYYMILIVRALLPK